MTSSNSSTLQKRTLVIEMPATYSSTQIAKKIDPLKITNTYPKDVNITNLKSFIRHTKLEILKKRKKRRKMAANANKISGEHAIVEPTKKKRTVLDEIQARCALGKQRENRCKDIRPLYEETKQRPHLYSREKYCADHRNK
uniref:Uncharacterized protein n=1 Tax=Glossina pallidipes TaxID=7398 RepID=A0A1B0A3Z9_GLOPL